MQSPESRQMAVDFQDWLARERQYTIKLFRVWSAVQDALLNQWHPEGPADDEETHILRWISLSGREIKKLEFLLNIMDFGDQYNVNLESPARKALFKKWLQTQNSSTPQN